MGEACRQQGLASIPVAADTLGGWHKVAAQHIKKLGAVLARHKGEDEQVEVRHLFQRLSLLPCGGMPTSLSTASQRMTRQWMGLREFSTNSESICTLSFHQYTNFETYIWFEITKQITYRECNRDQIV